MLKRCCGKLALLIAGSAVLLQAASCTQFTADLANFAQIITAGGVIYLVTRVME